MKNIGISQAEHVEVGKLLKAHYVYTNNYKHLFQKRLIIKVML